MSSKIKILFISNPYSGGKNGKKILPYVEKQLKENSIEYHLHLTEYSNHAYDLVKNTDVSKYQAVVSLGGDGTNYEIINGLLKNYSSEKIPPIGIIPVGSGNSFARDLEIYTVEDGISSIINNRTRNVDVCRYTQGEEYFYFVNLMGLGFVTDVADTATHFKWLGDLSYVIGVFHRTASLKFHSLEIEIDGKPYYGENCFLEVCNSRFTGGSMLMSPESRIDDGLMDLVILSKISRGNLLSTFPKIFKGTHLENPAIEYIRCRNIKIKTSPEKNLLPDGELRGKTPTEVDILPGHLRYLY